jgi:hypothetical protein
VPTTASTASSPTMMSAIFNVLARQASLFFRPAPARFRRSGVE